MDRNRRLDNKVNGLESSLQQSNDLVTQLRHELNLKTDLLHAYTDNEIEAAEDSEEEVAVAEFEASSSIHTIKDAGAFRGKRSMLAAANVILMQRKVKHLQEDNKKLQEDATELAKEAFACEEKEVKLVSDAVKHLTEANVKLSTMNVEYHTKAAESLRQKEEITHLLAKVCDLQANVKKSSSENAEMQAQLEVYKETQDELTSELADFKEKYREIVDLLHDTQEELKSRKRSYVGMGTHKLSEMFSLSPDKKTKGSFLGEPSSLQSEIHRSLKSSKHASKKHSNVASAKLDSASDFSDSDMDIISTTGGMRGPARVYSRAFSTYKSATANKMLHGCCDSSSSPVTINAKRLYQPGTGSSLEAHPPESERPRYDVIDNLK